MKQFYVFIGIFAALSRSRFIPHPPNFTSLLALSFYVPTLLGLRYLPALLISFAITDFIIGYHNGTFFTWGSVFLIGLIANKFSSTIFTRLSGALFGALIFFIVTNFGVWLSGMSGYNFDGLIKCYYMAMPFFGYSLVSTLSFSFLFEIINYYNKSLFIKVKSLAS